jgi:transcriptional antiterminator
MKEKAGISLPEGEIGFIVLHIHSGITNKMLSEVNKHSWLVSDLVEKRAV